MPIGLVQGIAPGERLAQRLEIPVRALDADDEVGDWVYLDRNEDHVGTATLAYQDDQVYTWLQTKHL